MQLTPQNCIRWFLTVLIFIHHIFQQWINGMTITFSLFDISFNQSINIAPNQLGLSPSWLLKVYDDWIWYVRIHPLKSNLTSLTTKSYQKHNRESQVGGVSIASMDMRLIKRGLYIVALEAFGYVVVILLA